MTVPVGQPGRCPASARSSVDLPDPFGPRMVTISPRSIRSDDVVQHLVAAEADADVIGRDQAHAAARWQAGQRPSASILLRSIGEADGAGGRRPAPRGPARRAASATASQSAADQEGGGMRLARVHAGGEGVQPADAVGKPLFHKELQRAIGDRRLVAEAVGGQPVQHVIGPQRAVCLQQDLQRAAAHRGQPRRRSAAVSASARASTSPRAMGVVMRGKGQIGAAQPGQSSVMHRSLLTCYDITYITPC